MTDRKIKYSGEFRGIYALYSKVSNKVYIGQAEGVKARLYAHKNRLKNNKHGNVHLQNHVNKYGWDSLEVVILVRCTYVEHLTYHESLQANNHIDLGFRLFNQATIKDSHIVSKEYRSKLSSSSKALWQDEAYRNKVISSVALSLQDPEVKKARAVALKESWDNDDQRRVATSARMLCQHLQPGYTDKVMAAAREATSKRVQIFQNNVFVAEYQSARQAEVALGIGKGCVSLWALGSSKSRKGYTASYV